MKKVIPRYIGLYLLLNITCSCTYSLNIIHTQGMASDLVDEQQTPSTNVSASIPISAIPE